MYGKINCFRCQKAIDEAKARFLDTVNNERRYECFACYQKSRNGYLHHETTAVKRELYCERGRYKFLAKQPVCPYCSKDDAVILAAVSVHDLL